MSVENISHTSALNAGNDLWVIQDFENSYWFNILNWYLNFQILKIKYKPKNNLDPKLVKIIISCEFDFYQPHDNFNTLPILIASSKHLPNQWTIISPIEQNSNKWINQSLKWQKELKANSIRFFLSEENSLQNFINSFPKEKIHDKQFNATIVGSVA